MLKVHIAEDAFVDEKNYIIKVLLENFLGVQYKLSIEKGLKNIVFTNGSRSLKIDDTFFPLCQKYGWLTQETMPSTPLKEWSSSSSRVTPKLLATNIPVIYGSPRVDIQEEEISIGMDIFGSSFFMLSRYEEAVIKERDEHDRFPAKASLAFKENFLLRPIVNEYLEILWFYMKKLWPELIRKERSFKTSISCDVDFIRDQSATNLFYFCKRFAKDIIQRKSSSMAFTSLKTFLKVKMDGLRADPYYTFDFIMDICEAANTKAAFYFITDHSGTKFDGYYSVKSKTARQLLKHIDRRGHEIGLHPSYNTYLSYEQVLKEALILENVLKEEKINQIPLGGRQHFLRWRTPDTARVLNCLNLMYDSTLGFADHVGFRCGVCYEYPIYDIEKRLPLSLIERPLVVMDCSGLSYMKLDHDETTDLYINLKKICKKYQGNFTLLWHNTSFLTAKHSEIFKQVVNY